MNYTIGDSVFNDWIITRELGEGATGRVYEIEKNDHTISAKAALKVIRIPKSMSDVHEVMSEGMDEVSVTQYFREFVDEILREIKIMISLKDHPNIVGYEDHCVMEHEVEVGWDILIKMELLTPLSKWLLNHPMDEPTALRLGCEISSALAYATDSGLVHRDVKPENIFVDQMGRFKLGDFGIARTIEKTTGGLSKKGTESYMAPEVYLGKTYNDQIDIYSLGIVLYRLMNNNRLPFYPPVTEKISFSDRETALMKRMQGTPLPAPANGSREFQAVILKACEYLPENRYESMHELYNVLQKLGRTTREIPEMPVSPKMQENGSQETGRSKAIVSAGRINHASQSGRNEKETAQNAFSGRESTREEGQAATGKKSNETVSKGACKDTVSKSENSSPAGTGKKKKMVLAAGLVLALGIGGFAVHYGMEYSKTYEVTVENGTEKGDNGGIYHKGNHVTVVADAPDEENVEFSRWLTDGIELSEEDRKSAELTFSMPKENVSLKAQYKLKTEVTTIKGLDASESNSDAESGDEIFTGDLTLTKLSEFETSYSGNVYGIGDPEPLMLTDYDNYELVNMDGTTITGLEYSRMSMYGDKVIAKKADTSLWGILSTNGEVIVPFEYDYVIVSNEYWLIGFKGGSFEDEAKRVYNYDFDTATLYSINGDQCTSAALTSEQKLGNSNGAYFYIENEGKKELSAYDLDFNIVATGNTTMDELKAALESLCIGNPEEVSEEIEVLLKVDGIFERIRTLREQGYKVVSGYDRSDYLCVTKSAEEPYVCGVVDKENNLIIPMEYDFIYGGDNLGYFYVEKDGKCGYVRKDGTVTVEPTIYSANYPEVDGENEGVKVYSSLGFSYREKDGTYTLVAADGTKTTGMTDYASLVFSSQLDSDGRVWETTNEDGNFCVIDWHGNTLLEREGSTLGYIVKASDDFKYMTVQERDDYESMFFTIYEIGE